MTKLKDNLYKEPDEIKAQRIIFKDYFERAIVVKGWNTNMDEDGLICAICGRIIKEGEYFIAPPSRLNNHIYDYWCMNCWDDAHDWSKCDYI